MFDGYGDSTRAVKAVSSEAVPGQPVGPVPGSAAAFHLSADEGSETRHLRPRLQSQLAPTRVGPGPAGRRTAALSFGSGMAAITAALRAVVRPGSVLVVPVDGYYQVRRYAAENLVPLGVTVREASARRSSTRPRVPTWCWPRRRPTRRSTWSTCTGWPGSAARRRPADGRQHHRHPAGPAAAVAGCRPGGGQRNQGALGAQRPAGRLRRGQPPRADGRVWSANGCWPVRSWARSRPGCCCAAWAAWACACPAVPERAGGGHGAAQPPGGAVGALPGSAGGPVATRSRPGRCATSAVWCRYRAGRRRGRVTAGAAQRAAGGLDEFGGLHTWVDRRARWGDAVPDGFARISAGIEDTDDLVADVVRRLDRAEPQNAVHAKDRVTPPGL